MAMLIKRGLKHLSRVNDVLFRTLRIERDITIFPDDVFLTSYPRSGNTWTRFLVGNLVHTNEPVTFLNVERLVADMYKHGDHYLRGLARPRILKSHEVFDPRYKRVIYIVRDPRDCAVSNFHWEMKQRSFNDQLPIKDFLPNWIEGKIWDRLGNWGDHVTSWLSTRSGHEGFLLLRYEDMIEDPARELMKVSKLLGIEQSIERCQRAAELSSFDRMRKLEEKQGGKWVQTAFTRQDKPFVRQATKGGWREVLPPECVAQIEAAWGHVMIQVGYQLVSDGAKNEKLAHQES
jgi:hypothetical protein